MGWVGLSRDWRCRYKLIIFGVGVVVTSVVSESALAIQGAEMGEIEQMQGDKIQELRGRLQGNGDVVEKLVKGIVGEWWGS